LTLAGVFASGLGAGGILVGLIFAPIVLLGVPLGCWRIILAVAPDRVFRKIILPRHQDSLLKRFRVPVVTGSKYFLGPAGFPNSLTWRILQTVSIVFLIASKATTQLATVRTSSVEEGWFFGLALLALSAVTPFIALLWIYEDSGVRVFNKDTRTVSKAGTWIEQILFGTGVATSVWNFALSIQGGTSQEIALLVVLIMILVPPCLVVTVVFHRNLLPMFVDRFLASRSASFLSRRDLQLVARSESS
jgi:hypothetical protein